MGLTSTFSSLPMSFTFQGAFCGPCVLVVLGLTAVGALVDGSGIQLGWTASCGGCQPPSWCSRVLAWRTVGPGAFGLVLAH